ncbi:MAG: hypothetical protein HYS12_07670 [Planctomycetes bacterium]|nr:hypothetical protein [Planctomycetota bacterium]
MRTTRVVWAALGAATLFVVVAGMTQAAPAPVPGQAAKPVEKWEYAEIHYSSRIFRGGEDGLPGGGGRGGRGGGAPGGGAAPAQPVQAAQPALPRLTVRWVTGDGELLASSWEELAAKLKAPEAKPGATTLIAHKLRVLNHLGSQGWEMISTGTGSTTSPWVFKRKVAK